MYVTKYSNAKCSNPENSEFVKVTVLLINNFIGAKAYCVKLALLCLFCAKWT